MPPYIEIAGTLEGVSREERRGSKADLLASLLKGLTPEIIRPAVRLLSGRLWPPWEPQEMGIGPEILGEVLEEISGRAVSRQAKGADPGDLARSMVQSRSQQTLTSTTTDMLQVYESLRMIPVQRGAGSIFRKKSILKGLLLSASPLEAKYIARTVLGRMMVGLGPSLMSAAIGKAFSADETQVKKAYARLPDFGMVALKASRGEIFDVRLAPPNPARMMLFRRDNSPWEMMEGAGRRACVVRYGGLRIQVHRFNEQVFIYTSQLRNVTSSLADLAEGLLRVKADFIMEGEFVLVRRGEISPRSEMLGRINLKSRSRGSAVPSFAASDLLYLDGKELIDESYAERRRNLSSALGGVAGTPLSAKVFLADEAVLSDPDEAKDLLKRSLNQGYGGLLIRDLSGTYAPGEWSRGDVLASRSYGERSPGSKNQGHPHQGASASDPLRI